MCFNDLEACKSFKVLFVGNSYTFYNDMPETIFANEALAAGYKFEVTSVTKGGYRLSQFADPENEEGKRLRETISGKYYDFAVIQDHSLSTIINQPQFFEGIKDVMSLISADRFILYATWGRNDQSEKLNELGITRQEMTEKISIAYNKAAKLYGASVAEVGKAFLEYSMLNNKDELYNPDNSHPSLIGSKIAAKEILKAMEKSYEF